MAPDEHDKPRLGSGVTPAPRRAGEARPHVRVMTTGVFDLLHPGHIRMLEEAKRLGDELVVVLARDRSAQREKHRPITPEEHRRRMVAALKPVDLAVLGHHGDYYRIVEELRPDIIALGFDQKYDEKEVAARCAQRGVPVRVVRLPHLVGDLDGTRKIIARITERAAQETLYRPAGDDVTATAASDGTPAGDAGADALDGPPGDAPDPTGPPGGGTPDGTRPAAASPRKKRGVGGRQA